MSFAVKDWQEWFFYFLLKKVHQFVFCWSKWLFLENKEIYICFLCYKVTKICMQVILGHHSTKGSPFLKNKINKKILFVAVAGTWWHPEWFPPSVFWQSLWVWRHSGPDPVWTSHRAQTQAWVLRVSILPHFMISMKIQDKNKIFRIFFPQ